MFGELKAFYVKGETLNNLELCRSAIHLAEDILGQDNLLVAFIAGSRAKGNYNLHSDIDLFVIINYPSRENEKRLAEELKNLHEKQGLIYDHCGEIFSQDTLNKLLEGVKNLDILVKHGFCRLACYQTGCILSVARKTQVVLHMLSEEKEMIIGNFSVLQQYENTAKSFYSKHDNPAPQLHLQKLRWTPESNLREIKMRWQSYVTDIENRKFCDTPVGIGLERWFLSNKFSDETPDVLPSKTAHTFQSISPDLCPLWNKSIDKDINSLLQSQCLGVSQNN